MFPEPAAVPRTLHSARFRLEPLGPEHNDADHQAWSSSIDHIRATPGFTPEQWGGDSWPHPMSPEENRADLEAHAREFVAGEAYAFTVLDPASPHDVIGCLYVDPDGTGAADAAVRLWVSASRAHVDAELHAEVVAWFQDAWPPMSARFPGRDERAAS